MHIKAFTMARLGAVLVAAGVLAVMPATSGAAQAAPASSTGCQVTEVTLHGSSPATSRCVTPAGDVALTIASFRCGSDTNDLALYWNGPINVSAGIIPSGPILCIRGSGTLDLSRGLQFDRRNWNDQASAWWAGCSPGHFGENDTWWNPGAQQSFSGGAGTSAPSGNFTGQNGTLRNDSLTDVTLDSNC